MNNFALNVPINSVSFGQTSIALLREIKSRNLDPVIFPIGNPDIGAQKPDNDFNAFLQKNINRAISSHKRDTPIFKLWHLSGSLESFSNKQVLLSFLETDSPTAEEINTVKNNAKVFFTNQYTVNLFKDYGLTNVEYLPLFLDSYNFYKKDKTYFTDGRISFLCTGKFESKRKKQDRIIRSWIKKYGNNPKYHLVCNIFNPFIKPEDNQKIWGDIVGNQRVGNITFLGWMPSNEQVNDMINSIDVVIGCGSEGWGIPEFSATALGKNAVILNCAGYKSWCNELNACLIQPNSKHPAYDGMFFHQGQPYNQGNFFDYSDDEFLAKCDEAIERVNKNRVNVEGLKLQEEFTVKKTVDKILEALEQV